MIKNRTFLEAVGIISGMIIGSGEFALPYSVVKSGMFWAIISGAAAFLAVLAIHLAYGEIVVNTEGTMRLPGYTEKYLGKKWGTFSLWNHIIGFSVFLVAYGILAGTFLSNFLPYDKFWLSLFFFLLVSVILSVINVQKLGFLDFFVTALLILFALFIFISSLNNSKQASLPAFGTDPFFSFGIFVFAFTGLSSVADAWSIFKGASPMKFKTVVILGTAIPLLLYTIFVSGALSAVGVMVSVDAVSSLGALGRNMLILGTSVGLLAVFISYITLGYDLVKIYEFDAKFPPLLSRGAVLTLPLLIFIFGAQNFIKILSVGGGIFIAVDGILILWMLRNMRAQNNYENKFLSFGGFQQALLFLIFSASVCYEVIYQIF